jgi:hypothetical protein
VTTGTTPLTVTQQGIILRSQGETEEVSDVTFSCGGAGQATSNFTTGVSVDVALSLPVTSKSLPTLGVNATEASLLITDNVTHITSFPYIGIVTGNLITFTNVTFPANFTARLADVRVNASLAGQ